MVRVARGLCADAGAAAALDWTCTRLEPCARLEPRGSTAASSAPRVGAPFVVASPPPFVPFVVAPFGAVPPEGSFFSSAEPCAADASTRKPEGGFGGWIVACGA